MIRRIQSIKEFGVFEDFQWPPSLPEFKQFNLIYGWNYSGKTTLSRAFRCFEQRLTHVDFAGAHVQLSAVDGTSHDFSTLNSAPVFRVFNSDFVRENLSFTDSSAIPILVLGAEDIANQAKLKATKVERETLALKIDSDIKKRAAIEAGLDKSLTVYARDFVKTQLTELNYDRRRFEPKVVECKGTPERYLLDDAALARCLAIYRATEKKSALSAKTSSLSSVTALKEKASTLLRKVVSAANPILRLKEDPTVERWVDEGRRLHAEKNNCQFCGQRLPHDLIAELSGHFSADYEKLMTELAELAVAIHAAAEETVEIEHKADFYEEFSERFASEKRNFEQLLRARTSTLDALLVAATTKKTKAFTAIELPPVDDPTVQITNSIEAVNKTIAEHNKRTAEFDKKRQDAFSKLEKHYAALFVREEKYIQQLLLIEELKATIVGQQSEVGRLDKDIREIEQAVSEEAKGAERINQLLVAYFGRDDLRISVSPQKRFQIVRGNLVAKNLSEGEKTAIAFAYFITRVQDGRHSLADTRIVIDDPISSLDANHLFNTYALIKTQLGACCQLFISTHSFEFYNLVREWAFDDEKDTKKPQANWKKWSIFFLKRSDEGKSVLTEIPKELLKFKSEYHYLFSILYHFDKETIETFELLLSLPNVVRRFMEAFGGIMIPLSTGLNGKMERLFADNVERERVWKFINNYSHNTTITRSLTIPDTSECKAVVRACLRAVIDWDELYFKDLEGEVAHSSVKGGQTSVPLHAEVVVKTHGNAVPAIK